MTGLPPRRKTHGYYATLAVASLLSCFVSSPGFAQAEYRNIESGRPVRISDATPTERHSLDLDLTTIRIDRLSLGRYRLQVEPRVSYGILPRMDISMRALGFYREPSAVPRGTVAGIGVGGEYLVKMESLRSPAIGIGGEAFFPTGPNASRTAYSIKGLMTRTFSFARVHLNASYGTFSVRIPPPPPDGGGVVILPPIIDGPCSVSPADGSLAVRSACMSSAGGATTAAQAAVRAGTNTGAHWLAGIAVDKTLPLQSILLIGDVYTERYEGIGRPTDWTAELAARTQVSPRLVVDLSLGRHYLGLSPSWFGTLGSTVSLPLRL
jgi:hypothetical protein